MMIYYTNNNDLAMVLGRYFRRDKKTGYYLASKTFNGVRKRLHVFIWEYFNGAIPKGYQIHHKDHNKYNNEISNLELLPKEEHTRRHIDEMTEEERKSKADNLNAHARPKACEWHKSDKGREWHRKHYEEYKEELHKRIEKQCVVCNKTFLTYKKGKFCSNNCKSAYRRASQVDNVERECICCGETFITNKYSKRKYCEKHWHKSGAA